SAAALAADLQRWLHGRPVEARPPSLVYRMRKFVRRRRLGVAAGAMIAAALSAGAIGTLWQGARARPQAARALEEARRAGGVRDFRHERSKAADPDETGGEKPDLLAILAAGAERAQQDASLPLRTRAQLLSALGTIYSDLGRFKEAQALLDQSIALWQT